MEDTSLVAMKSTQSEGARPIVYTIYGQRGNPGKTRLPVFITHCSKSNKLSQLQETRGDKALDS